MGLDMSTLVGLPVMDVFARPIDVYPNASNPGGGSYRARGYYSTAELDVQAEDGSVVTDQQTYLDVRDREFAIVPRQKDVIDIPADGATPAEGMFEVVSATADGKGLTNLIIRKVETARPGPPEPER
jgi:hypothetical protein